MGRRGISAWLVTTAAIIIIRAARRPPAPAIQSGLPSAKGAFVDQVTPCPEKKAHSLIFDSTGKLHTQTHTRTHKCQPPGSPFNGPEPPASRGGKESVPSRTPRPPFHTLLRATTVDGATGRRGVGLQEGKATRQGSKGSFGRGTYRDSPCASSWAFGSCAAHPHCQRPRHRAARVPCPSSPWLSHSRHQAPLAWASC